MRRIFIFFVMVLFLGIILIRGVSATTYYIKNGGNNLADGLTDGNAWETLAKVNSEWAAGTFAYGDNILFKKGDTWTVPSGTYLYLDYGKVTGTGSTENRIKIGAYGTGASPIIEYSGYPTEGYYQKIFDIREDYVEIDGLHFKRGVLYAYYMDYALIENCTIEGSSRGIWLHGYCTHNEIQYNTIDAKEEVYVYLSYEGIQVGYGTDERPASAIANQYNLIHNNIIKGWSHAQVAIYAGEHNEVYDNYVYDDGGGVESESSSDFSVMGISINGRHNKIYGNYIKTIHYDRVNGQDNEFYNNIYDKFRNAGTIKDHYTHCAISLAPNAEHPWDVSGNKFHNNIFYGAYEDWHGGVVTSAVIYIYKKSGYEHDIRNNEFSNNIILDWRLNEGYELDLAVIIIDDGGIGDITGNIFRNNVFYKEGGAADDIIRHQGTLYTVAEWNAADPGGNTVDGNIISNPGVANAAAGQFWASDAGSSVVDAGALGYSDFGLDSSSTWTPNINIKTNPRIIPDIGPYEYIGDSCTESWTCTSWSAWSACVGGIQTRTRTCTDQNTCGTTINKPDETETQSCGTGLVAYYTMDSADISGTTLYDRSGNNNDGTIYGATTATGRINQALSFDGIDDYINCGNDSSLNVNYLTASLWFKPNSFGENAGLFAKGDNFNRQYWAWIYQNNLSLEIDEGGYYNYIYSLNTDTWHHLSVTYDGFNIITYIDGIEVNRIPQSTGEILIDDDLLFIGKLPGFISFNGSIDDVRIYNYALNSTEILALYNQASSPCGNADSNTDGSVSITELINYITQWKAGEITITELIAGIGEWKNGC